MPHRLEITLKPELFDAEGEGIRHKAADYFDIQVDRIRTVQILTIDADLSDDQLTRIQDAVNYVAITAFGGNVCVQPGTYVEPKLKLVDGVYLVALSDDPAATIIDGDGHPEWGA